ncbi:MAG: GldG family protein [Lentisphaerae bacterium]|nr:GldG family protein [Lentisphaerota bacterium]
MKENTTEQAVGTRRLWLWRVHPWLSVLLAVCLAAMANFLSERHFFRRDFSEAQTAALSDRTKRLLDQLPFDTRVIVYFRDQDDLVRDVKNLLREYAYASRRVKVEVVDPDRDLARSKDVAVKYELTEANVVVFDGGGKTSFVEAGDVAEFDARTAYSGQPARMTLFKGEQVFSSALLGLMQTNRPVVYFLGGHGERSPDNYDPAAGYSSLVRRIRNEHMDVKTLVFGQEPSMPADLDALVIAGPRKTFVEAELNILKRYLEGSGRLLVLLDAGTEPGLDALLADWGVTVGHDRVAGLTLTGNELLVRDYGDHPITRTLWNVATLFNSPRSIQPAPSREGRWPVPTGLTSAREGTAGVPADRPVAVPLAWCSERGWAEMTPTEQPPKFDPATDRRGPIPVAVAVEKGPVRDIQVEIRPTRLAVFGDSSLVANGPLSAGYNPDIVLNALNWVLGRDPLLAIAPREPRYVRLAIGQGEVQTVFWLIVVLVPALAVFLGFWVWIRRRK